MTDWNVSDPHGDPSDAWNASELAGSDHDDMADDQWRWAHNSTLDDDAVREERNLDELAGFRQPYPLMTSELDAEFRREARADEGKRWWQR